MQAGANPVASFAERVPVHSLSVASIAARLFGALLLVAVAFDQSYDPTQAFVLVLAAAASLTLVPVSGASGDRLAAFGAGLVFFAGAVLTHFAPGLGMLAMGLLSGLATFALAVRHGRDPVLPAVIFVAASLVTAGLQVAIVFTFE